MTEKSYEKSKLSCWKQSLNCSEDVIEVFCGFGNNKDLSPNFGAVNLKQFVITLYCKYVASTIPNLDDLRWYVFSKFDKDMEYLHPTKLLLLQAVDRVDYAAYAMKSSDILFPDLQIQKIMNGKNELQPITTTDAFFSKRLDRINTLCV